MGVKNLEGSPRTNASEDRDQTGSKRVSRMRLTNDETRFAGAVLDTGAARTVIGRKQARAYMYSIGRSIPIELSNEKFRFGDIIVKSLGSITIRVPFCDSFFKVQTMIVPLDVPFLLGLDAMDTFKLELNIAQNKLSCLGQLESITRSNGHLVYSWPPAMYEVCYTKLDLYRAHRSLAHPSPGKLYALLRRARPNEAPRHLLSDLQLISDQCGTCQKFSKRPLRFMSTFPTNCGLGEEISVDLMNICGRTVLHVVDSCTSYSSAAFLPSESAIGVWQALMTCWLTFLPGFPRTIRSDSGPQFTSESWKKLCAGVGVTVKLSPVESHNSLGQNERLHGPLRRCFLKLKNEIPTLPDDVCLRVAVKAMNDTVGPDGLVPTLLVFGTMPQLPMMQGTLTTYAGQAQRESAIKCATSEYKRYVAERRIREALAARTSPAMETMHVPGDLVLIYREKSKIWEGPYTVVSHEKKVITVKLNDDSALQRFNVSSVKRYIQPVVPTMITVGEPSRVPESSEPAPENQSNVSIVDKEEIFRVMITEVLPPGDPRGDSPEFLKAKLAELSGLKSKGTWKEVWEKDVPSHANKMRGRFVLAIKNKGTGEEVLKARFVAQGFCDREKNAIVHTAVLARQASTRTIVSLACAFGWNIQSHDVTQAYLQADDIQRDIYLRPPTELGIRNKFLLLKKPLYGLTDAGDIWYNTLSEFVKNELALHELISDPGVLFRSSPCGKLEGMILIYVDDLIITGCSEFLAKSHVISERFKSRPRKVNQFRHAGVEVHRTDKQTSISQKEYSSRLERIPKECCFEVFRSARAKLQWLVNTRPDIAGSVALLAQVTPEQYENEHEKHNKELNRVILYAKRNPFTLLYLPFDFHSARLVVYADASYAANTDRSSQIGFIVSLVDLHDTCHVLAFSSKKSARVVTSIFSGEAMALALAFSLSYTLQYDIRRMTGFKPPIHLRTDSLAVFDAITKNTTAKDHRLLIDIAQLRQSWHRREVAQLAFIRSKWNIADTLTKRDSPNLSRILKSGRDQAPLEQWINRSA